MNTTTSSAKNWQSIILQYSKPRVGRSVWQIINSLGPYLLLWVLAVQAMKVSFWLALPVMVLAAGFLVRIFIIFHDCGHGSFFKSKKANVVVGKIMGILALTPYYKWTESHQYHHQTVGNLDKRGDGDVWTLTVEEYREASRGKKFIYALFRNPFFLFFIAGPFSFVILNRFTRKTFTKKQKRNVYFTNMVIGLLGTAISLLIGWQTFLLILVPVTSLGGMAGIYLFYLQHQYEDVQWERTENWDYKDIALKGSSFFNLPLVLRWFTGNIGFHHIHHLGPKIPNYNLVKCHEDNAMFRDVKEIKFFESFQALKLRLWDEQNRRIISFGQLRAMTRQ